MLLKPMRFKDYTWPHNPEIYAVEYRRQIAAHKIPLGGWYLQDLGRTYRIFRGEGIFAGERAYEEFQTLAEVFDQTGPGLLVHPVWRTVSATPYRQAIPHRVSPFRTVWTAPQPPAGISGSVPPSGSPSTGTSTSPPEAVLSSQKEKR